MVKYLACDTLMERYLTTLDSPFFLKLMPEIKVTVATKLYMTPRCVHKPNLGFLCQIILDLCSWHDFSRSDGRGKGRVRDAP